MGAGSQGPGRVTASAGPTLGHWVIFLFAAGMAVDVVAGLSTVMQISLLNDVAAGRAVTATETAVNDARQQVLATLQLVVSLAMAVVIPAWFRHAHGRLRSLGVAGLRFSPAWAAAGFFVPVANLILPYRVARQLWRASDPAVPPGGDWGTVEVPRRVAAWWGLFLLSGLAGAASIRVSVTAGAVDGLLAASWLLVTTDVLRIGAAFAGLRFVAAIDGRELAKAASPGLAPPVEATPSVRGAVPVPG